VRGAFPDRISEGVKGPKLILNPPDKYGGFEPRKAQKVTKEKGGCFGSPLIFMENIVFLTGRLCRIEATQDHLDNFA